MVELYSNILIRVAVLFYALWIGGLATTIFNRIPNEIPIGPSQKPRCNNCGYEIKFKYFFPVIGYFLSNGKCINCKMKIPRVYLFIELTICLYILLLSMTFPVIDEKFISKSLYGAFLIVLGTIYYHHKKLKSMLLWMLLAFILLYRGYNECLPKIIELFLTCISSYIAFFFLKKKYDLSDLEFKMCIILITSLGGGYSFLFLTIAILSLFFDKIHIFQRFKKVPKFKLKKEQIIFFVISLGIVMSLII